MEENTNSENIDDNKKKTLKRRKISDEIRAIIIKQASLGASNTSIAEYVNLPRTTVASITSAYLKLGKTVKLKTGGDYSTKLSLDNKNTIKDWVDQNAAITLREIKAKILRELDISISLSTINRCLKNFHYSLKSMVLVPERRNDERTLELRSNYAREFTQRFLDVDDRKFIFLDEVGFSLSTRTKKGRSEIGTSAYMPVNSIRSRNISVIAAMNKYGMINYTINNKPVNGEDFKQYLRALKEQCNTLIIDAPIFIMDNARIHHYRGLQPVIEELNLTILYLPPYSPFLNPIENVFSQWKNFVVRSQASNEDELFNFINTGFNSISRENCESYFRKMNRFVAKSLNGEIILE